jgi:hypothetical protein
LIRPLSERTRLLRVLLWLMVAASTAWLLLLPFVYLALRSVEASTPVDSIDPPVLLVAGVVAWVIQPLAILVGVVFLMWVYRATANLRAMTAFEMRFTPGWSVGWYFVPILGLVRPYQGMCDIWRASHRGSSKGRAIVGVWWFLALGSVFVMRVLSSSAPNGETVGAYATVLLYELPGYAFDLALYAVTLRLIIQIGAAYDSSVHEWAVEHPAVPAGWYEDPASVDLERFWDGSEWGDDVRAVDASESRTAQEQPESAPAADA